MQDTDRAMRLSAILITKNEAANIGACLDSLAFCDERIVVDCGSSDGTPDIAAARGARVAFHEWEGFGAQKNHALALATGDWALSIDADERVSAELAAEIRSALDRGDADGYELERQSSFCGHVMRHSRFFPDHVLRLVRRGKGRFTDDLVHERLVCDGPVGRLKAPLAHHSVVKLEDAIRRIDGYSTLGAQAIVASGRRVWFFSGIVRGLATFLRVYILRLGFIDGAAGFMLAVANAEGTYYRYMKAWLEMRRHG
jgi:glycosyltransferase involved in cell wall biosynthesis